MKSTQQTNPFVRIDPATGVNVGPATVEESIAYQTQPTTLGLTAFRKAIRVGDYLIDEDTGPGRSHTPGRFVGGAS